MTNKTGIDHNALKMKNVKYWTMVRFGQPGKFYHHTQISPIIMIFDNAIAFTIHNSQFTAHCAQATKQNKEMTKTNKSNVKMLNAKCKCENSLIISIFVDPIKRSEQLFVCMFVCLNSWINCCSTHWTFLNSFCFSMMEFVILCWIFSFFIAFPFDMSWFKWKFMSDFRCLKNELLNQIKRATEGKYQYLVFM